MEIIMDSSRDANIHLCFTTSFVRRTCRHIHLSNWLCDRDGRAHVRPRCRATSMMIDNTGGSRAHHTIQVAAKQVLVALR